MPHKTMKRISTMIVCLMTAISILAQNKDFCLADNGKAATIAVDANDWKGVLRAANDLCEDVNRVTGVPPHFTNCQ